VELLRVVLVSDVLDVVLLEVEVVLVWDKLVVIDDAVNVIEVPVMLVWDVRDLEDVAELVDALVVLV
jgi:hypothetical protein